MDSQHTSVDLDHSPTTVSEVPSTSHEKSYKENEKLEADIEVASDSSTGGTSHVVLHSERDIATRVISVDDDPSLNPWTLRAFILGLGLSAFGGSLAQIYYFKPQTVIVSLMFLGIISYVLGIAMDTLIPRHGLFRYLNPHTFNKKENAFIVIMASAAANSALATEVLAVQRLYYNITPSAGTSIFLLFSSQLLGYGIGGAFRSTLLHPSKMFYPVVLPLMSMLDAFFRDGADARRRLKVFYLVFGLIFIWELFPEWVFPLLGGLSAFCLAFPNNTSVSQVFGGSNGNEGLGIFSLCLDWQYIGGSYNPMVIPLRSQVANFIGYILCLIVFGTVFYGNIWKSRNFPILSQLLFYENGTQYNQSLILNSRYEVDPTLLAEQGLPYFAGSWVVNLIVTNMGLAATFTHMLLWNRDDLNGAWSWMSPSNLRRKWQERSWQNISWKFWEDDGKREEPKEGDDIDPHYAQMIKYPDAPNSWYYATFVVSFVMALVVIYKSDSTLPWWGFLVSVLLAIISVVFFGALYGITGISLPIQTFVQMIGGYLHHGKPMANMYFVLFSYNTVSQSNLLLRDLKIAQYAKLPPRASFTAQTIGTVIGAVLNYFIMISIVDNQREILLSVQGTNIWSGQQPQQYNSQAVAWGGLSHELFSSGTRYQWVTWSYLIGLIVPIPFWLVHRYWPKLRADYPLTPIICWNINWCCTGVTSTNFMFFSVAFVSQYWARRRYPRWFQRYNYPIAAALDGGTQVIVFILSFAVAGAAGSTHLFPKWWGANQDGNYDHCKYLT